MKYTHYIISFLFKSIQSSEYTPCRGLFTSRNGIVGLYEFVETQSSIAKEKWCITHVHQISHEEFEAAKKAGIIDDITIEP